MKTAERMLQESRREDAIDTARVRDQRVRDSGQALLAACKSVQQWADEQGITIPVRCGLRTAIDGAEGGA